MVSRLCPVRCSTGHIPCPLVSRLCPVRCSTGDFPLSLWSAGSVPCINMNEYMYMYINLFIYT